MSSRNLAAIATADVVAYLELTPHFCLELGPQFQLVVSCSAHVASLHLL